MTDLKTHIKTDRWFMREVTEEDIQGFFELDSDPLVHQYLGNQPVQSIDESAEMVKSVIRQYAENGIARWAVIDKATQEFAGWSGLKLESKLRAGMTYYDLGYRLKPKFWGKGIATETSLAALKYGFEVMQLTKICAAADLDNLASNRVLQKVGFQFAEIFHYEGVACNWYTFDGNAYLGMIEA